MKPTSHKRGAEPNEVDRRLEHAMRNNLDPNMVSPSKEFFAWYPVYGWIPEKKKHGWIWLRRVSGFCPLGLFWEYSAIEKPTN